jgi:hypothetical protein
MVAKIRQHNLTCTKWQASMSRASINAATSSYVDRVVKVMRALRQERQGEGVPLKRLS